VLSAGFSDEDEVEVVGVGALLVVSVDDGAPFETGDFGRLDTDVLLTFSLLAR